MGNGGDVPSHRNARRRPASGQALALGGAQAPAWRSKRNGAGRRRPGAGGTPRSHGEGKASRDAGPWRGGGRLSRRRRGLRPVHHQRLDPVGDALSGLAQLLDRPVRRAALGDVARPQILAEASDVIRRRRRFLRDRLMGASSWRRRRAIIRVAGRGAAVRGSVDRRAVSVGSHGAPDEFGPRLAVEPESGVKAIAAMENSP